MQIAEHYAMPVHGHLGGYFQRVNEFVGGKLNLMFSLALRLM